MPMSMEEFLAITGLSEVPEDDPVYQDSTAFIFTVLRDPKTPAQPQAEEPPANPSTETPRELSDA